MSAAPLPSARIQFVDQNGAPLVGGSVTYYVPGTLAPKRTWSDLAMSAPNPPTITLDGFGSCLVFGLGTYRQVVRDQYGALIWDNVTQTLPYASAGADALSAAVNTVLEQVGEAQIDYTQALKAPVGEAGPTIPSAADRAGKFLGFDVNGNPFVGAAITNLTGSGSSQSYTAVGGEGTLNLGEPVASAWLVELFRNGVRQRPITDYICDGSETLTLAVAASTGEYFDFTVRGGLSAGLSINALEGLAPLIKAALVAAGQWTFTA